ncbi:MAG: FAD-dependent monooxygenase [Actinophytocola sp.]|uniref:FAD-dependent oxidoreductase n=1 Tax=Actinophytocola sp. TaxID=1872138 RepID=UPI00132557E8|nr:FAD-dependent monooxygenase [Actinophytocola sp.]MPZ81083.1 FAD-dependent monooxygenase [Actinophytocola sp.]
MTIPMKALIIGGGMAGPVTGMACEQAGIDSTVYEAYDRTADGVGAFLTLAVNGLAALRTLGLSDLVRDKGVDTPSMVAEMDGRRLAEFSFGAPLPDGTRNQTITRADLYGILRDEAVRRGVPIEYGKRLVSAESTPDGVLARFADGSTARGDLLIGADGLRSATRRIIDPNAPAPRYVPLLNAGGYARGVTLPGEPGVMHMFFGRRCFFSYVARPDGEVWWFANPPQPTELAPKALAAITPEQWRTKLRDLFAGDDFPALKVIDATEHIFSGWNTYDYPKVPVWHRDGMIIIGDAAHATSPASGQGASMAIEDAVTLAKCLRDLPDIPQAFAAYEGLRRKRVERVVAQGKRNGDGKAMGRIGRMMLPTILKFVAKTSSRQGWLYDHRIEWNEPVSTA